MKTITATQNKGLYRGSAQVTGAVSLNVLLKLVPYRRADTSSAILPRHEVGSYEKTSKGASRYDVCIGGGRGHGEADFVREFV